MTDVPMEADRGVDHGCQDQVAAGAQLPAQHQSNQVPGLQGLPPVTPYPGTSNKEDLDRFNSHLPLLQQGYPEQGLKVNKFHYHQAELHLQS